MTARKVSKKKIRIRKINKRILNTRIMITSKQTQENMRKLTKKFHRNKYAKINIIKWVQHIQMLEK